MKYLLFALLVVSFTEVEAQPFPLGNDTARLFPTDTVISISLSGTDAALIQYGIRSLRPGHGIESFLKSYLSEALDEGRKRRDATFMQYFWSASTATKLQVLDILGLPSNPRVVVAE